MKNKMKFIKFMQYFTKCMSLTIFLTIFTTSYASSVHDYYTEQKLFTVKMDNQPVRLIIEWIEKNSQFIFIYKTEVNLSRKVSVNVQNQPIKALLDQLIKGSTLEYFIQNRQIILGEKEEKKESKSNSQKRLIGMVTDSNTGEPIIGASILLKNKNIGTITDTEGNFELQASENETLVISYIGYTTKEIRVGKQRLLAITLSDEAQKLQEVVVTAFGASQKKESVVGSVQVVRPTDLITSSANLSNAFAGRLAGVVAYQRGGMPGNNDSNFYIRGISTLNGVTSPLIILDGVEISSSDLNALDPDVIEGFSILKDATATAMYGTRGANGVMIITTKSGLDTDKPIISFRTEANITTPTRLPKFVNGPMYMRLYNEAVTNQKTGDVLYTEEQMNATASNANPYVFPNVDWYDELFKNHAFNQKANFSIRGGTSKITYFMNLNVNHETGMLRNRSKDFFSYSNNLNLMRYAFQNNIDFKMSKSSKIALHLNVQLKDQHGPVGDNIEQGSMSSIVNSIYKHVMLTNPVDYPVFFPADDTQWVRWGSYPLGSTDAVNPVANLTSGYSNTFRSAVIANIDFEQKLDCILEGLRFKTLISFKNVAESITNRRQGWNQYYLSSYEMLPDGTYDYQLNCSTDNPTKPVMNTYNTSSGNRHWYFQTYLDYNHSFGNHSVNGMLLANLDNYNNNFPGGLISSLPQRKIGFAIRASYDYAHRYMAELNAGYNGSENFAEGHRFGFFPSIALGWNISQEKFWKPLEQYITHFKLRASYGLVGNDQIGSDRFIYMPIVDLDGSDAYQTGFGSNKVSYKGIKFKRFENKEVTWEVGEKLNLGVDFQLFHDVNISFDIFREIRKNIFQKKGSIPNYLGATGIDIYGNLAKVKNWGTDISIDYGKQITSDFSVQFKGTFTFARNRVLEYDEAEGVRPANSHIGHAINSITGYVTNGLYVDDEDIRNNPTSTLGNIAIAPGDIKYVDQPDKNDNYDNKITSDDKVTMGYPTVPEIVYGFGPSIAYKKWDFSFFFQGVAHTSLMMSDFAPFGKKYNRNVLQWIADDYWSEANPNPYASHPRLTKYENEHNNKSSDYWLRNAAFLKLKNIELGYKIKKGPRIYFSATNLLTFSPFKHWDPEMGGGKGLSYPTMRTFNIGIQMSFNK